MQTYISILRGINLGGHKTIKMEALRALYTGLGFAAVQTYIQSGNVVFQGTALPCTAIAQQIADQILATFGFDVPVLVLTQAEWAAVLAQNPFLQTRQEDVAKLHVTFLATIPEPARLHNITGGNYGDDEWIAVGKTVYLFCPDGYGNTKLSNTFFENKLKVSATTRNWKTVEALGKMGDVDRLQ